jgi:hypothetical protein
MLLHEMASSWLFFGRDVSRQWRCRSGLQLMQNIMRSFTFALGLLLPSLAFAENKEAGKALSEFFEAEWNYEMEQSPPAPPRWATGAGTIVEGIKVWIRFANAGSTPSMRSPV